MNCCSFEPCWLTPSPPSVPGGGQADSEPAEGQQFPFRLARWGGVSSHEPRGKGSPAERSLQRRGLHRGGRSLICQKGRQAAVATLTSTIGYDEKLNLSENVWTSRLCFFLGHSKRLQDDGSLGQSYWKECAFLTPGRQREEVPVFKCFFCLFGFFYTLFINLDFQEENAN